MAKKKILVYGSPLIEEPEIREVVSSMRSGWIGTGPKVKKFEQLFASYKGIPHAVALNSCTAALHLSMLAAGIRPKDEVLVPALTFAATANAVIHAGAKPVFVDCEKDSMTLDPLDMEKKITRRTKAVVPVHFGGRACRMDAISGLAKKNRLKVIEDCAHAIETEYHGKKAGTMGELGCFSFYVTKNITTGEGGMVITRDRSMADRIKILALHGMSRDAWERFSDRGYKHYQVVEAGFKYNMMDLQAAIGIHQLSRLEKYWRRRREIWQRYDEAFRDLPVFIPLAPEKNTKHAYHLYTILLDTGAVKIGRDRFMRAMFKRGIGTGVHYSALHLHPFYRKMFGHRRGDFPNTEWVSERTVSLPLSPKLSDGDVRDVISAVRKSLRLNRQATIPNEPA